MENEEKQSTVFCRLLHLLPSSIRGPLKVSSVTYNTKIEAKISVCCVLKVIHFGDNSMHFSKRVLKCTFLTSLLCFRGNSHHLSPVTS